MSSGGGGSNTSTTTSGPPQQFLDAYQNTVNRATGVANQPLQQYSGNVVAGLSPDQQAGISAVQNAQGVANPFINAAAQQIGASTNPLQPSIQPYANDAMAHFTAAPEVATLGFNAAVPLFGQAGQGVDFNQLTDADIQRYQNPYTQNVIDATQAQFNNQNAQQQAGVVGNSISNNSFGGDRQAVAQALTAEQQQMAQAPVIAGLRNQGYAQALAAAQQQQQAGLGAQQASIQAKLGAGQGLTAAGSQLANAYQNSGQGISGVGGQILGANQAQNWLASQAGFGYANLGNEALQTSLTGANALLGTGGLEQQLAQENLNVPYQQFIQQQAYPFQTTSFLANIAEGLGGAAGGQSTSTSPGPSGLSQGIGLGLAGLGAANQLGAFGNSSGGGGGLFSGGNSGFVDSGAWDVADGGAIPQRAPGGMVPVGNLPPDLSISYIPEGGGASGKGSFNLLNPGMQNVSQTQSGGGGDSTGSDVMKGIGTAASIAAMFFSDRRLKDDISHVGRLNDGTPISRFRFKGDPHWHIGVIADEVEHRHPEAVGISGGYKTVDHKAITEDSVEGRAFGGPSPGITAFPMHRARMPGTNSINDNQTPRQMHPMRMAAGGTTVIDIPQLPGGIVPNAGPGGNGILIPQVGAHNASAGISAINDYLNASKAPPPTPNIIPNLAASIVPPPRAPSIPFGGMGNGVIDQSFVGGGAGGNSEGGGAAEGVGGGGDPGGVGAEGAGGGSNSDSSGSGSSEGFGSRGGIVRRASGGDLDSPGLIDPASGMMPLTDIVEPTPLQLSDPASGSMPPAGIGGAPSQRALTPAAPPPQVVSAAGPPPPPAPAPSAGITAPVTQSAGPEQPQMRHPGEPQHPNNWGETLLAMGLGMMGGTSPHAGVNIGRGGLQGLQYGEQQALRREQQATRALTQQQLADYRSRMAGTSEHRANTGDFRADTGRLRQQDQAMIADRSAQLRARGIDQHAADQQALQEYRSRMATTAEQRADTGDMRAQIYGQRVTNMNDFNILKAQLQRDGLSERAAHDRALEEAARNGLDLRATLGAGNLEARQQGLDQGAQRIQQAKASFDLRSKALEQTKDINDRRMIQNANANEIMAASRIAASPAEFANALKQVRQASADPPRLPAAQSAQTQQPAAPAGVVRVQSPEEAAKLPSGTQFMGPDGVLRQRP